MTQKIQEKSNLVNEGALKMFIRPPPKKTRGRGRRKERRCGKKKFCHSHIMDAYMGPGETKNGGRPTCWTWKKNKSTKLSS